MVDEVDVARHEAQEDGNIKAHRIEQYQAQDQQAVRYEQREEQCSEEGGRQAEEPTIGAANANDAEDPARSNEPATNENHRGEKQQGRFAVCCPKSEEH